MDCGLESRRATAAAFVLRSGEARRLLGLVGVVAALSLVGAILGVRLLASASGPHDRASAPDRGDVGRTLATSFGLLTALDVETLPGLTAKDLAGVTHFPSYVGPERMQVQVSVEVRNVLDRPVPYAPGRFRLRVGEAAAVAPSSSTVKPGSLRPGQAIDGTLVFVAPRSTARLRLEFRDASGPILLDLGRAARAQGSPLLDRHPAHDP